MSNPRRPPPCVRQTDEPPKNQPSSKSSGKLAEVVHRRRRERVGPGHSGAMEAERERGFESSDICKGDRDRNPYVKRAKRHERAGKGERKAERMAEDAERRCFADPGQDPGGDADGDEFRAAQALQTG